MFDIFHFLIFFFFYRPVAIGRWWRSDKTRQRSKETQKFLLNSTRAPRKQSKIEGETEKEKIQKLKNSDLEWIMGAPGNGIKWFYFAWLRSRVSGVNTERTVTRRLSAAVMSAVPKQFTHVTHWSWRHTWSLLTFEFFFFFFLADQVCGWTRPETRTSDLSECRTLTTWKTCRYPGDWLAAWLVRSTSFQCRTPHFELSEGDALGLKSQAHEVQGWKLDKNFVCRTQEAAGGRCGGRPLAADDVTKNTCRAKTCWRTKFSFAAEFSICCGGEGENKNVCRRASSFGV